MLIERLSKAVIGRDESRFFSDIKKFQAELSGKINSARILVIGGAGSIGSATIRAIYQYSPDTLHVIDHNENQLAELVRDMRSSGESPYIKDFRTLPLDFGGGAMKRFLFEEKPYDYVLNFAAIKHVRSEKDVPSLLQMLDTNIVKAERFIGWLAEAGFHGRYFSVSTDKAANPVSLMGASKRLMEHLIFSSGTKDGGYEVTSARFANVAFSDGSLLDSFTQRMQKKQPFAVPKGVQRYFISLEEAGHICLLAAFCALDQHLLVPCFKPEDDLCDLEAVARRVLNEYGYQPCIYTDEIYAKKNVESDISNGRYPLLITSLDTSGEKPYEEFVALGEHTVEIGMDTLSAIKYSFASVDIMEFVTVIDDYLADPCKRLEKDEIVRWISKLILEFRHISSDKKLDDRM